MVKGVDEQEDIRESVHGDSVFCVNERQIKYDNFLYVLIHLKPYHFINVFYKIKSNFVVILSRNTTTIFATKWFKNRNL